MAAAKVLWRANNQTLPDHTRLCVVFCALLVVDVRFVDARDVCLLFCDLSLGELLLIVPIFL